MNTETLTKNDLSEEGLSWLKDKYTVVDSKNQSGTYRSFFADDSSLRFGNGPLVEGGDAIVKSINSFFTSIHSLEHQFLTIIGTDDYFVAEAQVTYQRVNGGSLSVPAATLIERNKEGLVQSMRIFVDISELYS